MNVEMEILFVLLNTRHMKKEPARQMRTCYQIMSNSGKEPTCQCRFDPWVGKILWRRAWQPTPVSLPGESQGQRGLVGYNP